MYTFKHELDIIAMNEAIFMFSLHVVMTHLRKFPLNWSKLSSGTLTHDSWSVKEKTDSVSLTWSVSEDL